MLPSLGDVTLKLQGSIVTIARDLGYWEGLANDEQSLSMLRKGKRLENKFLKDM